MFHLGDLFRDAFTDRNAATANSDDQEILDPPIFLDDFNRHPADCTMHPRAIEEPLLDVHAV